MANVWKIGSRWSETGAKNKSIISIFRRNDVVFVGSQKAVDRFKHDVKQGDYIAIADGLIVCAVAKVIDKPRKLSEFNLKVTDEESLAFNYEECKDRYGAKVKIVDIKECFKYRQGELFEANSIRSKVIDLYENSHKSFSINSFTCIIGNGKYTNTKEKYRSLLDNKTKFVIPIYQRAYSWQENQVSELINDIFTSYWGNDQEVVKEPMFIGTMQLSQTKYISKSESIQEVIDGQQRLSTITVLLKVLKELYPECESLNILKLNWIETRVNNGEQNKYLTEFLNNQVPYSDVLNPYAKNAKLIYEIINQNIEDTQFNIDDFTEYITSKIYFVVIETFAGLTKTLQIFNAINTTGLDLNGSDIFKIKMYEYLTDVKGYNETAFDDISKIYSLIDEKNKHCNITITSVQGILDLYRDFLIAKYNLPNTLFQMNSNTFYERLFDTLLGVKEWDNFRNLNNLELSLSEIEEFVNIKFEWHEKWSNLEEISVDSMFALNMIWRSRYGRYGRILYQFLYQYKDDNSKYEKLSVLLDLLNKIFFCYSITRDRAINEIHNFAQNITKRIVNSNDFEEIINELSLKLNSINKDWLKEVIKAEIPWNKQKRRILICLMSCYLDEKSTTSDAKQIQNKIFSNNPKDSYDIEHINARNNKSIELEQGLENCIGNFVILESSINRSIKDDPFDKKRIAYKGSKYESVKKIANYEIWDRENIIQRQEKESDKITSFVLDSSK